MAYLKKSMRLCLIIFMIFGLLFSAFAETQIPAVTLYPVHNDTPFFKRTKDRELGVPCPVKMVKIRNNPIIKAPPDTTANVLYYGEVKLGYPPVPHGILFDLEGKAPQLWVDAEGRGDYSAQAPQALYQSDKYPGINVYYAPAPLTMNAGYEFPGHGFQMRVQFELPYLIVAQAGFEDFFFVKTRTWLTGVIAGDDDDIRIALLDTNDNGYYYDPEDLIFIDWNYDLNFTLKESLPVKSCKSLKLPSKQKVKLDFSTIPEKINLKKG